MLDAFITIFRKFSNITIKKIELNENRAYAEFPELAEIISENLPVKLEKYFNDNLPLRTKIIYKYRKLWKNFNTEFSCRQSKGKNGHYYLNSVLDDYQGKNKISVTDKYNLLRFLEGSSLYWKQTNVVFCVLLAPYKPNIYPNFMPVWVKKDMSSYSTIFNWPNP